MKLRAYKYINENGEPRYVAQYRFFGFWRQCNDIGYGLPGPSYRSGYPTEAQCNQRLAEFQRGE